MADFTPLTSKIKHAKFLVLDIESKDGDSDVAGFTRPFMVGVYDGEKYHAFFDTHSRGDWERRYYWEGGCVDRAMRFICRKKYRGYQVYAHNAGRFDYLFLLPWLMHWAERLGMQFSVMPVASAIQLLNVTRKSEGKRSGGWKFLDSLKLIPLSLDKAAKSFGLEGKLEHDLNVPESDHAAWIRYNRVDCVQLYEVMTKFHHYVERVLLGEVGITAPSTSIKLLRRRYLKTSIPRNESTHDFVRAGYVGGRTEAFAKEGHNLRYYDFNSSYPASMLKAMPGPLLGDFYGTIPSWVLCHPNSVGFVECDVMVPDMPIPPLPVRGDGRSPVLNSPGMLAPEKLLFPVGRLKGIWEWSELENAVKCGAQIVNIRRSVWYEGVDLFGDFVRDLYKFRDKSLPGYDDGLAQVVKILLNSAYGKFGMKTVRKKIYMWDDPELPENAVPASSDPESLIWYADEVVDAPYIMPQVSARVTALSRVALHKGMMRCLELGGEVDYCDTDSILTTAELPSSTKLGELKDEFPEHSGKIHGIFIGPKMYLLDAEGFEYVKCKGVEKKMKTRASIEALQRGDTIYQVRLEKVGALAQANFLRGPRMNTVPRSMKKGGQKRLFAADGSSRPYELEMW